MATNAEFLDTTASHIRAHTDRARESYAVLSEPQLNWKPNPSVWSVGVVLNHLITTHRSYFPVMEDIVAGTYKMKLWTRISPFSAMLGRSLISQLSPGNEKKFKSPPAFRPTHSKVGSSIHAEFAECQAKILQLMEQMAEMPIDKIKIASPASSFITYPLRDALQVIDVHTARHFQQADRLMQLPEFPA